MGGVFLVLSEHRDDMSHVVDRTALEEINVCASCVLGALTRKTEHSSFEDLLSLVEEMAGARPSTRACRALVVRTALRCVSSVSTGGTRDGGEPMSPAGYVCSLVNVR